LIATHAFLGKMHKTHFAGGTVEYVRNDTFGAFGLLEGVERWHDGTIAFSALVHLGMALQAMRPDLRADGEIRVRCLAQWLAGEMLRIRWPNRHPLIRIVGSLGPPESFWAARGGTISFVPYDPSGNRIAYASLFRRLAQYDIDLRHGCMCNTVGTIANPGLTRFPTPGWRWVWDSQHDMWSAESITSAVPDPEADMGVVRISLGLPSTFEDVFRILECLQSVVAQPLEGSRVIVPRKQMEKRLFAIMNQWCIS
jgi:molybdenum cofactor sulfurtransferase